MDDQGEPKKDVEKTNDKSGIDIPESLKSFKTTNARIRTVSENSGYSDAEIEHDDKRARTGLPRNSFFPEIPPSPPKFVSLEEIMKAANALTKMAIAHEIVVNKDFRLEKTEPQASSTQQKVHTVVHQAFWDVLASEIHDDPPIFTGALKLLEEIKEGLLSCLLPHHTRIKEQISDVLDLSLIKQQAEASTLDFQHYAQYILSVMSRLCAPVRDEQIRVLMKNTDVVAMFKGILQLLELMKIDMANFAIKQLRPTLVAQSVEYEKKKFSEFLSMVQDQGPLEKTMRWLTTSISPDDTIPSADQRRKYISIVLNKSFISLLESLDEEQFPETMNMDKTRFLTLRDEMKATSLLGTALLISIANMGPHLQTAADFKLHLKERIHVIVGSHLSSSVDLKQLLSNISLQVVKDVQEYTSSHDMPSLDDQAETALRSQIEDISGADNKIRNLVEKRILEFLHTVISSTTASPAKIPPGLSALQTELTQLAGGFERLTSHNRAVFGDYYAELIGRHLDSLAPP